MGIADVIYHEVCIADSGISASIDNPKMPDYQYRHESRITHRIPPAGKSPQGKTYRSTTGHSTQKTRRRGIRRLVLTTAQPRNGNDLLDRLTGNPITSRSSRIRRNDLEKKPRTCQWTVAMTVASRQGRAWGGGIQFRPGIGKPASSFREPT